MNAANSFAISSKIPMTPNRKTAIARANRDRGERCGSTPPTPPYIRVRIRRFGGLRGMAGREGRKAERGEGGIGQYDGERGAVADPPRAVGTTGALGRQVLADAAPAQLRKAGASAFPLLPGDRAQASPDPLVKPVQHRWGLADAEVAAPPDQVD